MKFRLPREAATGVFKNLQPFKLDFDMYYFCLVLGLAAQEKEDMSQAEAGDLVDTFPGEYGNRSRILIAFFLARELSVLGIEMGNKSAVRRAVAQLVDMNSPTKLSERGMREINRYAFGGYLLLANHFAESKPQSLETFLPLFKRLVDEKRTATAK